LILAKMPGADLSSFENMFMISSNFSSYSSIKSIIRFIFFFSLTRDSMAVFLFLSFFFSSDEAFPSLANLYSFITSLIFSSVLVI
jgi:hypothetical protein